MENDVNVAARTRGRRQDIRAAPTLNWVLNICLQHEQCDGNQLFVLGWMLINVRKMVFIAKIKV